VAEVANILVVSEEAKLRPELESALGSLPAPHPHLHFVPSLRQGIESVRSRQPELALLELTPDIRALETFAREAADVSPDTLVVAVFRPDGLDAEVSESAILIQAIRAGVSDFLRRPVSSSELQQLLGRLPRRGVPTASRDGAVVSFISNKGGVGKTTAAVNAACALALRHPNQVLLIDTSLQLGTCASMLDVYPQTTILDAAQQRDRLDETLLEQLTVAHESGLHLLAAPPTAVDAAEVDDAIVSQVITLARRAYGFVIVDTFPVFDRIAVAVLDHSDLAYVVVENVVPTLLGATKLLELLQELEFPPEKQRLLINRYAMVPGSLRPVEVANRLHQAVEHVFPYEKRIVTAANTGRPFALQQARFSKYKRELKQLVASIEQLRLSSANGLGTV